MLFRECPKSVSVQDRSNKTEKLMKQSHLEQGEKQLEENKKGGLGEKEVKRA